MIDTGGGRHTYQAVAWAIRDQITRGMFGAGDAIPSLPAIREQYKVSNPTAQAAVRLLKTWGLVRSEAGRGTYVLASRPVVNLMTSMTIRGEDGTRRTWRDIVAEYGMTGTQRVTGAGRAVAPVDVLDAFGYEAGTAVTWRQRLLLVDDQPVQVASSYYPDDVVTAVPALGQPERLTAGAPELMARVGWEIVGGRDLAFARTASEDEADTLGIELGAPVTEVLRTSRTSDGQVVTVERMVSDSARLRQEWAF